MQITLIYPPPWKISRPGETAFPPGEGPPAGLDPGAALQGDFLRAPYGLFSLAAQAIEAGHRVRTLNLANSTWDGVCACIREYPAALYGLSCLTANRRGVAMLAREIRRHHPGALIAVGGPHASALPRDMLADVPEIDQVVVGEGEATFMELVGRISAGRSPAGMPGTFWRNGGRIHSGPARPPIEDLDTLVSPLAFFGLQTLVTSRGCPGRCTFCGSRRTWGRRVRFHSAPYVLDMLAAALQRHPQRMIAFKDDTFTVRRERVLAICAGIRERRLEVTWSCEARADHLDEEMLGAMRLAGCRRISIGVESADRRILENIRKQVTPAEVLRALQLARKFGIHVRFYMMAGNRGETRGTFSRSLRFIRRARPDQFVFSQLHLYPGTEEFEIFCRQGACSPDIFSTSDAMNVTAFAGTRAAAEKIRSVLETCQGVQGYWRPGVAECRAVRDRLPRLPAAHLDLCGACLRAGRTGEARRHLDTALSTGFVLPGLAANIRACIAAGENDIMAAENFLAKAVECYPHQAVIDNLARLAAWQEAGGAASGPPPALDPGGGFETAYPWNPPETPDPELAAHRP